MLRLFTRSVIYCRINTKFPSPQPLGVEWEESSEKYTDYYLTVSVIPLSHPLFGRVLDPALQLMFADRILLNLGTRNMVLDPAIQWVTAAGVTVNMTEKVSPSNTPAGWQAMEIGDW